MHVFLSPDFGFHFEIKICLFSLFFVNFWLKKDKQTPTKHRKQKLKNCPRFQGDATFDNDASYQLLLKAGVFFWAILFWGAVKGKVIRFFWRESLQK